MIHRPIDLAKFCRFMRRLIPALRWLMSPMADHRLLVMLASPHLLVTSCGLLTLMTFWNKAQLRPSEKPSRRRVPTWLRLALSATPLFTVILGWKDAWVPKRRCMRDSARRFLNHRRIILSYGELHFRKALLRGRGCVGMKIFASVKMRLFILPLTLFLEKLWYCLISYINTAFHEKGLWWIVGQMRKPLKFMIIFVLLSIYVANGVSIVYVIITGIFC